MNKIVITGRGHSKELKGAESQNSRSGNKIEIENIRRNRFLGCIG